jgi:hypothetical protein
MIKISVNWAVIGQEHQSIPELSQWWCLASPYARCKNEQGCNSNYISPDNLLLACCQLAICFWVWYIISKIIFCICNIKKILSMSTQLLWELKWDYKSKMISTVFNMINTQQLELLKLLSISNTFFSIKLYFSFPIGISLSYLLLQLFCYQDNGTSISVLASFMCLYSSMKAWVLSFFYLHHSCFLCAH